MKYKYKMPSNKHLYMVALDQEKDDTDENM